MRRLTERCPSRFRFLAITCGGSCRVYHQLDDRIEAHIFTAFMALCLLQTLRAIAREHTPGLTLRQIIDKNRTVKMVGVVMPTTDGRIVTLPRYVEP